MVHPYKLFNDYFTPYVYTLITKVASYRFNFSPSGTLGFLSLYSYSSISTNDGYSSRIFTGGFNFGTSTVNYVYVSETSGFVVYPYVHVFIHPGIQQWVYFNGSVTFQRFTNHPFNDINSGSLCC